MNPIKTERKREKGFEKAEVEKGLQVGLTLIEINTDHQLDLEPVQLLATEAMGDTDQARERVVDLKVIDPTREIIREINIRTKRPNINHRVIEEADHEREMISIKRNHMGKVIIRRIEIIPKKISKNILQKLPYKSMKRMKMVKL